MRSRTDSLRLLTHQRCNLLASGATPRDCSNSQVRHRFCKGTARKAALTLAGGEDETDFSEDFPAFEGTNVETFDGFYFDANLQTPLIGTVQIAQATLIEGSGFSFSGIARYLVNGDKIDLSFDLSTIPGASSLAAVLLLGAGSRRRS